MMRCSGVGVAGCALVLVASCLGEDGRFDNRATAASGGATSASTIEASSTVSASIASASASGTGGSLPSFTCLAAQRYASPLDQFGRGITIGNSSVYVAGELNGEITVGAMPTVSKGGADALLFSTDNQLAGLWGRAYGDAVSQRAEMVTFSPSLGDLFFAGTFAGKIVDFDQFADSGGDEDFFWARVTPTAGDRVDHDYRDDAHVRSAAPWDTGWVFGGDYDGNIAHAGDAVGKRDAFVAWAPVNLDWSWAWKISSAEDDTILALAQASNGYTAVVGEIKEAAQVDNTTLAFGGGAPPDAFVVLFDDEHEVAFGRGMGDNKFQQAVDVAFDANGNVIVVGTFDGTIMLEDLALTTAGGRDVFVVTFAPNGEVLAANTFGGEKDQTASGIALTSDGRIVVAGTYLGAPDFGGQPLPEHAKSDVFVLVLDANLNHLASAGFGDAGTQRAIDVAVDASDHVYLLADVQDEIDFGTGPLPSVDTSVDIVLAKFAP